MSRPCYCDIIPKNGESYDKKQHCRKCWRYHTDERYRQKWDNYNPSLLKKITNFALASIKHVASGLSKLCDDEFNKRINICNNCEKKVGDNCLECGCILAIKARWATEDCPLKKWPLVVIENTNKNCNCKNN